MSDLLDTAILQSLQRWRCGLVGRVMASLVLIVGTGLLSSGCGPQDAISDATPTPVVLPSVAPLAEIETADGEKHRGISWVAGKAVSAAELQPLAELGVNWIVQTPFGWQKQHNSPDVRLSTSGHVYWGEQDVGIEVTTQLARDLGIKTLLKPHIWLRGSGSGKWRSDIAMENEPDWETWFDSYRTFMLHYAKLAQRLNIEALAIGTELRQTVIQKPGAWRSLIAEIRSVYGGQLTYSANWYEEFEEVTFWDQLDFIGIQAYFPLTDRENPSLEELKEGWNKWLAPIESLHLKYSKPVLFTEIGYRSSTDAAIEPWEWPSRSILGAHPGDLKTQLLCYQAFFETFWRQPWFAGAYIWKWHPGRQADQDLGRDFSPQGKPAESLLAVWYGKTISERNLRAPINAE